MKLLSISYHLTLTIILTQVFFASSDNSSLFQQRYAVIKNYLNQYSRPFTLIEINAEKENPFSLTISQEYPSTCLIFGSNNYHKLSEICTAKQLDNILIASQQRPNFYFKRISDCEHFDIVVIPNVQPNENDPIFKIFERLTRIGDHTIIEIISCKENAPKKLTIENKTLQLLKRIKHNNESEIYSNFYVSYNPRNYLARRRWGTPSSKDFTYTLSSNFETKTLLKYGHTETIPWLHGINLYTFARLQGIYPTQEEIIQKIKTFSNVNHGDLAVGNIIIQGKTIKLIDWDEQCDDPKIIKRRMARTIKKFLFYINNQNHK